tara:strand:- start:1145 stop:1489 length:345 start_codon:yes stop_codon:yes gene_type:complete
MSTAYDPKKRNYAYLTVSDLPIVIPDGTRVEKANFEQLTRDTVAIQGENLEFSYCNLANVKLPASATTDIHCDLSVRKQEPSTIEVDGQVVNAIKYYQLDKATDEWVLVMEVPV